MLVFINYCVGFSFCLKKVTLHGQLDEGKGEKLNQDEEKGRKDIEDIDKTGYLQEKVEGHWVMTGGQRQHGTMIVSWDYDDCVGLCMQYRFRKTARIMNISQNYED